MTSRASHRESSSHRFPVIIRQIMSGKFENFADPTDQDFYALALKERIN